MFTFSINKTKRILKQLYDISLRKFPSLHGNVSIIDNLQLHVMGIISESFPSILPDVFRTQESLSVKGNPLAQSVERDPCNIWSSSGPGEINRKVSRKCLTNCKRNCGDTENCLTDRQADKQTDREINGKPTTKVGHNLCYMTSVVLLLSQLVRFTDIDKCNETPHDKSNKMACAPSVDSDQPGHPPSLIRVFAVRMKKALVLSYRLSAQQRLWSDWADAQADLSLRWAHMPLCWFCHEAAQLCFLCFFLHSFFLFVSWAGCGFCLMHSLRTNFLAG